MELSTYNYEEFLNIVELLILEYYNIMCSGEFELNEHDIEILEFIEECDKDNLISSIESGETEFLDNIISVIMEYYEFGDYTDILDFSCYDYNNMNNVYKSDDGKKIYEQFHPNLLEELNNLNTYKKEKSFENFIDKKEINTLFEYIYYILIFKQIIKDKFILVNKFADKLIELKQKNNKLYNEILNYIISYFYVIMERKQKDNEELQGTQKENLKHLRNNNLNYIYENPTIYCFINEFIDYDIIEYDSLLNESNDKVKEMVKRLTIDNNK